jgi:hypothetical protein
MVSKCANPGCSASFRYFHSGRLFRVDIPANRKTHPSDDENSMKKPMRRLEFFWLCDNCSSKMTLTFDSAEGISIRPKFARSAVA